MATAAKYKVYNGSAWVELTFTPSSHTHSDYIKALSVSGKVITYTKGDGTTGTITTQDTNTTYSIATASTAGLVKPVSVITKPTLNSVTNTSGKYYQVQMSSDGNMFVNVPWTDTNTNTTYSQATSSALGLVKIGYTTSGKNYAVQLDSNGKMYVNVPWTDSTPVDSVAGYTGAVTAAQLATALSSSFASASHNHDSTYAKVANGVYFIEGTQTAATNAWTGTCSAITSLYDGLTINYYLPWAGTSTGATLALNGGTAYPIYRYGRSTAITTHFAAGSMIKMTFRTSYKVSGTSYTNAWIVDSFYDSNSYAYVRQYTTTTNAAYPLLFAYETTMPSSYDTKYTRKSSGLTYNPSTNVLTNSGAIVANSLSALGLTLKTSAGDAPLVLDPDTATYIIDGSQIVTKNTESVIDLGTISSTPASATCADLDDIKTPGIYTFKAPGYSADYPTTYIMTVSLGYAGSSTAPVYQHILGCNSNSAPHTYIRYCNTSGVWSYTSYAPRNYAASGNTSSKLFLIGRTSQSSTGGTTYSHDTVYVDTDGHLYDSGNRVLTTADDVGGGSGDSSVIDLGTTEESPFSATNSVLNAVTEKGLYAFKWSKTSPTRILQCHMEISTVMDYVYQLITIHDPAATQFTEQKVSRYYYSGSWTVNSNSFYPILSNSQLGTLGQILTSDGTKATWCNLYMHHIEITNTSNSGIITFDIFNTWPTAFTASTLYSKFGTKAIACSGYYGSSALTKFAFASATTVRVVYGSSNSTATPTINTVTDTVTAM